MIQKGIIEKIINRYQFKVRVPFYHKIAGDPSSTPTDNLPMAYANGVAGILPNYKIGDVVLVDFENDDLSLPVIMGLLYREEALKTNSDIKSDDLEVKTKAVLPKNTTIDGQSLSKFITSTGSGISDVYSIGPEPPADTQLIWIDTSVEGNPTLKVYDKETKSWFSTIGQAGKSAYQQAIDGGYTKSEETFMMELNSIETRATTYNFTAVIRADSWMDMTTSEGYYLQNVEVIGLLQTDNPIIGLIPPITALDDQRQQWAKISAIWAEDDSLKIYATEQTTINLDIDIKVVR